MGSEMCIRDRCVWSDWTDASAKKEEDLLLATVIVADLPPVTTPPSVVSVDPYTDLTLEAEAALVLDLDTKQVLFEKNSHTKLPLASITKLMTSLLADELLSPDALITISDEAIKMAGDDGLLVGEKFTRRNLSDLSLVCLLYTSPSPRDRTRSRMPSSA